MWPYPWTHVGTPSHLGHMDRVAATMPSHAHAKAAQEAPDIGRWEGQDVPLVRPSSCNVKGGILSSRRYLPTYLPRGLVRWVGGEDCGDMAAMKAEGQARLEPPRSPGYACMGHCLLAVGYVESGLVSIYEYAAGNGLRVVTGDWRLHGGGGTQKRESPLLHRRMRAALYLPRRFQPDREALAFCLLRCCCVAVPCPLTPGEQTDQRPSPLLMLPLRSCHCPQSLVDRYPRPPRSSIMLWATSGSPGTHGIEQGTNHLSARDVR